MAKENDKKLVSEERVDTLIHDKDGKEALRLGFITRQYEDGDVDNMTREAQNAELSCGTVYNSTMADRLGKGGMIRSCDLCHELSQRVLFRRHSHRNKFALASNIRGNGYPA